MKARSIAPRRRAPARARPAAISVALCAKTLTKGVMMRSLALENIGPIRSADLQFGDLTVLVGPQASGKSIALQWVKLLQDLGAIQDLLHVHGIDYDKDPYKFFEVYFGEGMASIWRSKSSVRVDDRGVDIERLIKRKQKVRPERVFLIPAQRVMALANGWPRPFTDYAPRDPYSVRAYSDALRRLMDREFDDGGPLFPRLNRLKSDYRDLLKASVFSEFELKVDQEFIQKRLVLSKRGATLPYMVWSAGQRELVPLLLGLYWLMPSAKISMRRSLEWAVIEELEMGLHPHAISTILLLVLELLTRGYKVCLSTHSPQVLELVWALEALRKAKAKGGDLLDVLGAPHTQSLRTMADRALRKKSKVYFFEGGKRVTDITDLALGSDSPMHPIWGGLLDFSERANTAVARATTSFENS